VPVIDGIAAVELVEALVGLGLCSSEAGGCAVRPPKPFAGDMAPHALDPRDRN
jgi:hypothetical protein